MASFSSLENIEVWEEARQFSRDIYDLTATSPFADDFSLKDQIRRAANSISLNIAEGYGLGSDREFIRHLTVARGSCKEVKAALYLALDQEYIDEYRFDELTNGVELLSKRITSLIKYLNAE